MTKNINEPISVYLNKDSILSAFIWRKRLYKVLDIISSWWEVADWWEGQPECLMLRVFARQNVLGTYELCNNGSQWFLFRVID